MNIQEPSSSSTSPKGLRGKKLYTLARKLARIVWSVWYNIYEPR